MATLSFSVTGPTMDLNVTLSISDSDAPRIMSYLLSSSYGCVTENVITQIPDAGWSPSEEQTEADRPNVSVQKWVTRPATPEEAAAQYAKGILDSLLNSTVAWEKAEAARLAAEQIAPISPLV